MQFKNKLKRLYLENQFYFVTVKTQHNQPIFVDQGRAEIFFQTLFFLKHRGDFELSAGVLLPDHFHLLLKPIKKNISEIMHDLKSYTTTKISERILFDGCRRGVEAAPQWFDETHYYLQRQTFHGLPSSSQRKTISIKIWQRSFHYRLVLDERDFTNHFNYILYNPVKHGYAAQPEDWPYLLYDWDINP